MNTKLLSFLSTARVSCLAAAIMVAQVVALAHAATNKVEIDGLMYTLNTGAGKAYVVGCNASATSVSVPDSIMYNNIGYAVRVLPGAFTGAPQLKEINTGNSNYLSHSGVLYTKDKSELIAYPQAKAETDYVIRSKCTIIHNKAFYNCKNLKTVRFVHDRVTTIGDSAFMNCSALTTIEDFTVSLNSLGAWAFAGCESLQSIELPSTLTRIERYTFCGCAGLSTITLPESVTRVEEYAFCGCAGFTEMVLPAGQTDIPAGLFKDCTGIKKLTIPYSVTSIGKEAFAGCTGLEDVSVDNELAMVKNLFPTTNIKVYSFGSHITSIPESFCAGMEWLTRVSMTNVVTINRYAFSGCSNLEAVDLPATLQVIERGAFSRCALREVVIPESLVSISADAFADNVALQKVTWNAINCQTGTYTTYTGGGGVKSKHRIGWIVDNLYPFSGCTNITSFIFGNHVESIPKYLCAFTGITSLDVPPSVKYIGQSAFNGCDRLQRVNISDLAAWCNIVFDWNYKNIGIGSISDAPSTTDLIDECQPLKYARQLYLNGEKIQDLQIPASVEAINDFAFYNCDLNSVDLNRAKVVGRFAFFQSPIQSLNLGENIDSIANAAFYDCNNITELTIPAGVRNILYGFRCSGLKRVTIGDSENALPLKSGLFGFCPNIKYLYLGRDISGSPVTYSYSYDDKLCISDLDTLIVGENVTLFDSYMKIRCGNPATVEWNARNVEKCSDYGISNRLTSITFGKNVNRIPANICKKANITSIEMGENVETIGENAFYLCDKLQSVTLPANLKSIETQAFSGCSEISELSLPVGITTVGDYSFADCKNLRALSLPGGITYLGSGVFSGCSSLVEVLLPEGLSEVPAAFFRGCTSLETVTIPSSVRKVGNNAFYNCESLTTINNYSPSPQITYANTFDGVARWNCRLNVPQTAIEQYKRATPWNEFIIGELADDYEGKVVENGKMTFRITSIDNHTAALNGLSETENQLTELVVPKQISYNGTNYIVTEIADNAFYENENITSVVLPASIERVGQYAFFNCQNLTSFDFNEGLKEIGRDAFYTTCLNTVKLPASLETIGKDAFYSNRKVKEFAVDENNEHYAAVDGVLFDKGVRRMLAYPGLKETQHYIVPSSCEEFYNMHFYNDNLRSITLGENFKELNVDVFYTEATIKNIYVVEENTVFKSIDGVLFSKDGTKLIFYPNQGNTSYRVPNEVQEIGRAAFSAYYNQDFKDIVLPPSITTIGTGQFIQNNDVKIHCGMTTVIDIDENTFKGNENTRHYHLYVPKGTADAYRSHQVWGNFYSIEEEGINGIDDLHGNEIKPVFNGMTLTLINCGDNPVIEIYDLSGIKVYSGSSTTVELPRRGVYIVRVNGISTKIRI